MEEEGEPAALRDDFHLTSENGQRHPHLSTHFKALFDRVLHVGLCFRFRLALTDASRNSRAFSDVGPILVARNGDCKLHGISYLLFTIFQHKNQYNDRHSLPHL